MSIIVIKPRYRFWALLLGAAASLMLPFSVVAGGGTSHDRILERFDKNEDGEVDRMDWRKMKADEKKTYARMSLEAIGESPDAFVEKGKTREALLLEGLELLYK